MEKDPALAARLIEQFADEPAVQIRHGDATRRELDDDSVGGAACFTMLHHVRPPGLQDRLFTEAARVVRGGYPPALARTRRATSSTHRPSVSTHRSHQK